MQPPAMVEILEWQGSSKLHAVCVLRSAGGESRLCGVPLRASGTQRTVKAWTEYGHLIRAQPGIVAGACNRAWPRK